ncbi:MAG: hypothetical protein AB7U95_35055 [Reyranella sp.]
MLSRNCRFSSGVSSFALFCSHLPNSARQASFTFNPIAAGSDR